METVTSHIANHVGTYAIAYGILTAIVSAIIIHWTNTEGYAWWQMIPNFLLGLLPSAVITTIISFVLLIISAAIVEVIQKGFVQAVLVPVGSMIVLLVVLGLVLLGLAIFKAIWESL